MGSNPPRSPESGPMRPGAAAPLVWVEPANGASGAWVTRELPSPEHHFAKPMPATVMFPGSTVNESVRINLQQLSPLDASLYERARDAILRGMSHKWCVARGLCSCAPSSGGRRAR